MPKGKCIVPNCDATEHSRGYCRKHYGRMWRGRDLEPKIEPKVEPQVLDLADAEKELVRMKMLYERVVGFEGRMRWSKKIRECEEFVQREHERISARSLTCETEVRTMAASAAG
jgi:hypothetical protein